MKSHPTNERSVALSTKLSTMMHDLKSVYHEIGGAIPEPEFTILERHISLMAGKVKKMTQYLENSHIPLDLR